MDANTLALLQDYARTYKGSLAICHRCGIVFVEPLSNGSKNPLCIVCENRIRLEKQKPIKKTVPTYGVCKICKRSFIKKHKNQLYCSKKCGKKKMAQYRYGVSKCSVCGKFFSKRTPDQRLCSKKCADLKRKVWRGSVTSSKKTEVKAQERANRIKRVRDTYQVRVGIYE